MSLLIKEVQIQTTTSPPSEWLKQKSPTIPNIREVGEQRKWQESRLVQSFWKCQTTSYKKKTDNDPVTLERTRRYSPKNSDSTYPQKDVSTSVCGSFTQEGNKLHVASVSSNGRMGQQINTLGQEILPGNKSNESPTDTTPQMHIRHMTSNDSGQTQKAHAEGCYLSRSAAQLEPSYRENKPQHYNLGPVGGGTDWRGNGRIPCGGDRILTRDTGLFCADICICQK